VSVSISRCICVSLGYAKSITRQATTPCTAEQPLEQSQPELQDPSGPHPHPYPHPTSPRRAWRVVLEFFNLICSTDFRSFQARDNVVSIVSPPLLLLFLRVALVVANLSHFYFDFALIFGQQQPLIPPSREALVGPSFLCI